MSSRGEMVAVKERWSDLQRVQCEGELRESNSGLQRHRNFDQHTKPYIYGNISYKKMIEIYFYILGTVLTEWME